MKLLADALVKYLCGVLLMGLLIFLPAGSLAWTGGWLLMGILFLPMLVLGAALYLKAPELLRKRLNARESDAAQKRVVALSGLVFLGGFTVAGLDFRFGWSQVPVWLTAASALLFSAAYAMYAEVMRENAYLSRRIELQAGQRVVDTGLYGIVRHPMYAASILLFLSMPLVLGSWYALLVFAVYPFLIAARIRSEESLLVEGLEGYAAYMRRVKYRLVPFIW